MRKNPQLSAASGLRRRVHGESVDVGRGVWTGPAWTPARSTEAEFWFGGKKQGQRKDRGAPYQQGAGSADSADSQGAPSLVPVLCGQTCAVASRPDIRFSRTVWKSAGGSASRRTRVAKPVAWARDRHDVAPVQRAGRARCVLRFEF